MNSVCNDSVEVGAGSKFEESAAVEFAPVRKQIPFFGDLQNLQQKRGVIFVIRRDQLPVDSECGDERLGDGEPFQLADRRLSKKCIQLKIKRSAQ